MRFTRCFFALVAGTGFVVGAALPAVAHVTVNPSEAEAGGFTRVSFRVPNERDDAATTQVEINLPEDHPIGNVSVRPVPGWEYRVERRTLDEPITVFGNEVSEVVGKITWSGGRIEPGEFQEFDVSLGPLPEDARSLGFPSLQTYDSGEVVRWIEETPEDGDEPEHPMPVLTVAAAAGEDDDDGDTNTIAVVALVVAIVAVLGTGLSLARSSRAR